MSSLSSIRIGIFNRSVQNGLVLFLLHEAMKGDNPMKMIKLLLAEDRDTIAN